MSRLHSICAVLLWLALVWGVLSWQPKPRTEETGPPTVVLSWNDFFIKHLLNQLPIAESFDSPLRPARGEGISMARPFASEGHLGEDWNAGEGDQDLGEPVYSPADGWVSLAIDFQSMWGNVVLVVYRLPAGSSPPAVEMMFAHLSRVDVKPLTMVKKGQLLGLMGNAGGVYRAHLHWEVREIVGLGLGGGYSEKTDGWVSPSQFLQSRNPGVVPFLLVKTLPESTWAAWGSD